MRQNPKDLYAERASLDQTIPVAIALLAWTLNFSQWISSEPARLALYQGGATVAGLALAAATFVCAMTYQSANVLMNGVRHRFARELSRNWTSIILSTLGAAILSILAIVIDGALGPRIAVTIALYALTLTAMKGLRTVFWLIYTLFADRASKYIEVPVSSEFAIHE